MDSQGQSGVRKKKHGGILLLQSMRVGKGNPLPAASFADIRCPLRERFVKMHIQGCWLTQGNAHLNNFVRNKSKNDKAMPWVWHKGFVLCSQSKTRNQISEEKGDVYACHIQVIYKQGLLGREGSRRLTKIWSSRTGRLYRGTLQRREHLDRVSFLPTLLLRIKKWQFLTKRAWPLKGMLI